MREDASAIFENDKTLSLILKFAAPTIVSLLINSFYNIVDQIFIGYGVGIAGNAATNIVYPVTTFTIAVSALIGDGAATYFSLNLGKKQPEQAARCAWTALTLSVISSLIILICGQIFTESLLHFLAATSSVFNLAKQYLRITLLGIPFVITSTVLSGLIRADGSPRYAMFCMLPGCFLNVILDAVFVLGFHWGMSGAAWATVLGQILNFLMAVVYIPRFQTISFSWQICLQKGYLFSWKTACEFLYMGQPIVGYNYGKQNYKKVKACLKTGVTVATICGITAFLIFQILPETIMRVFGQPDKLYIEFGAKCFRIFLLAVPLYGFSVVTTGLFQTIGKPIHATFMALSRQILYLIPLIMILTPIFGITGLLWSSPISDVVAFITCLILYLREIRSLV